jgi:hypothetical protein
MAGLGRKIFTAGDVLTASDVQSYLQDQTVMVFAGTAARSSAIATPTEGMFAVTTDDDEVDYYNGSAWVSALPVGAWKAYTPTLSGITLNNGTLDFKFCQIGKTVHVRGLITFGTTTALTTTVDLGCPVTAVNYPFAQVIGNFCTYSSLFAGAMVAVGSNTSFRCVLYNTAATYAVPTDLSTTVPYGAGNWNTGKQIMVSYTYEAA